MSPRRSACTDACSRFSTPSSTASFTFRAQTSGSWTQYTFGAEKLAGAVYTAATAIMNN